MPNQPTLYSHRRKEDGSHDSICMACLATIATHTSEAALAREEEEHVCKFAVPGRRHRKTSAEASNENAVVNGRTVYAGIW